MAVSRFNLDVVIFGGGASGLWLLDRLASAGHQALLLEANALGQGQTIGSQGIIHGGLKYSLQGKVTESAKAIRAMPTIWRHCLDGHGGPNLAATTRRAEHCYLWRNRSFKSWLGLMGASKGLRVTPRPVDDTDRPAVLRNCPGVVLRLDEQVISPVSFVQDLARQHQERVLAIDAARGLEFVSPQPGDVQAVRLDCPQEPDGLELRPRHVALLAGTGNELLRRRLGLPNEVMQRRPLHMVMLRGQMPKLTGHCTDGARTRLTITSDEDEMGRTIWQIGGQLAENGVGMETPELIAHARAELQNVLPDLALEAVQWSTYRVDRAEAKTPGRLRPQHIKVIMDGNVITGWPTKLALVPELATQILSVLPRPDPPNRELFALTERWPKPNTAKPPWETQSWFTVS